MKRLMRIIFCCFVFFFLSQSAFADDQQKALDEIAKFAEQVCQTAPIKSHSEELQLSGEATTQLKGLVSKIVNMGGTTAAKYKKTESEGVLQKDLASLLSKGTDCKQKIVEKLIDKLIPNPIPKKTSSTIPANWSLVAKDNFAETSTWETRSLSDDFMERSDLYIENGIYRWDLVFRKAGERYVDAPYVPQLDFSMAVDVRFAEVHSGTPIVELFFGNTRKQWYIFEIAANNKFGLQKVDGNPNMIIEWTPININIKEFNRMSVAVENSIIKLYINSKNVASYKDSTFSGGKAGLAVLTYEPGTKAIVDFANFELRSKAE